jgi:hypothetical protein
MGRAKNVKAQIDLGVTYIGCAPIAPVVNDVISKIQDLIRVFPVASTLVA